MKTKPVQIIVNVPQELIDAIFKELEEMGYRITSLRNKEVSKNQIIKAVLLELIEMIVFDDNEILHIEETMEMFFENNGRLLEELDERGLIEQ